jgi:hypothetical protein
VRFLFAPYINHWIGVTKLLGEVLFRFFGMRTYLPYLLPTLAAHLGIVVLLRVILLRMGIGPWRATQACLPLQVTGAGAVTSRSAGRSSSWVGWGSVWANSLLTDHDGPPDRRGGAGVLVGLLGLMCSGVDGGAGWF